MNPNREGLWPLLLLLAAFQAEAGTPACGDHRCDRGEGVAECPRDCGMPAVVPGSETVTGHGPNVRAVVVGGRVLLGMTSVHAGRASVTTAPVDAAESPAATRVVTERPASGAGMLGNASPFVFPDGRHLLIAYRDHGSVRARARGHRREGGRNRAGTYRLRVAFSADGGNSWVPGDAADGLIEASTTGLWEPFLFQDAAGALRVVYAKERENVGCTSARGMGQDIVMRRSPDGGHTWIDPQVVASEGISRDGVPSVARLKDGSYLMVFESWRNSSCGPFEHSLVVRAMQSRDGVHWEKRQVIYAPASVARGLHGDRASWPFVTTLADGRAAVTFTSDEGHPRKDAPGEKEHNFDIWLLLSKGEPSFDSIEWDEASKTRVFEYRPDGDEMNRFPSSVVVGPEELLVFSGLPERFRRVRLGHGTGAEGAN